MDWLIRNDERAFVHETHERQFVPPRFAKPRAIRIRVHQRKSVVPFAVVAGTSVRSSMPFVSFVVRTADFGIRISSRATNNNPQSQICKRQFPNGRRKPARNTVLPACAASGLQACGGKTKQAAQPTRWHWRQSGEVPGNGRQGCLPSAQAGSLCSKKPSTPLPASPTPQPCKR